MRTASCVICLEVLDPTAGFATDCGHRFHRSCMRRWLRRQGSCPICRAEVDRSLVEDEDYVPSRPEAAETHRSAVWKWRRIGRLQRGRVAAM